MNCRSVSEETLNDFADGLLHGERREQVESHIAECDACQSALSEILELREWASTLPTTPPARDLWPEIEARIKEPKVVPLRSGDVRVRRVIPPQWLAAAAVMLIVASSAVTAFLMRGSSTNAPAVETAALPASPQQNTTPNSALVAFRPTEMEYQGAAESLIEVLEARRHLLDPETVTVIEENLRIIDEAIAASRAALEADPANAKLPSYLSDVYRKKIDLLQHAVQLPLST